MRQHVSGTIGAANDAVTATGLTNTSVEHVAVIELDSTTAALNISFEATWDGTTWDAIAGTRIDDAVAGDEAVTVTVGNSQTWRYKIDLAGAAAIRARCSSYTSGSCTARITTS